MRRKILAKQERKEVLLYIVYSRRPNRNTPVVGDFGFITFGSRKYKSCKTKGISVRGWLKIFTKVLLELGFWGRV